MQWATVRKELHKSRWTEERTLPLEVYPSHPQRSLQKILIVKQSYMGANIPVNLEMSTFVQDYFCSHLSSIQKQGWKNTQWSISISLDKPSFWEKPFLQKIAEVSTHVRKLKCKRLCHCESTQHCQVQTAERVTVHFIGHYSCSSCTAPGGVC